MVDFSKEELQQQLDSAKKRIAELESQVREAGRDLDDRVRGAVDPIGERIEGRYGMKDDAMKDPVRIAAWLIIAAVVVGILYGLYNLFT